MYTGEAQKLQIKCLCNVNYLIIEYENLGNFENLTIKENIKVFLIINQNQRFSVPRCVNGLILNWLNHIKYTKNYMII